MEKILLVEGTQFLEDQYRQSLKGMDVVQTENLKMKYDHSLRVAANCRYLAEELELEERDAILIELMGLLHDVGRFAQFVKYGNFDDVQSEDHANLSVKILADQHLFIALDEEDQNLVREVISNHNEIEFSSSNERVQIMGNILRDADKMDNWQLVVSMIKRDGTFSLPAISYNLPKLGAASKSVIKYVLESKLVPRKELHSLADFKLFLMSMVYDLNFKASFVWVTEQQLIKKLYDSLTKGDTVIDAYRQIRLHIENRLTEKEKITSPAKNV